MKQVGTRKHVEECHRDMQLVLHSPHLLCRAYRHLNGWIMRYVSAALAA
nr:hypothetical protein [Dyella sp. ASV24]